MAYTPQWRDAATPDGTTTYGEVILGVARDVRRERPDLWAPLLSPKPTSRGYVNEVSFRLIAAGIPAGVNLKRGGPEESVDAIALPNPTGAGDSTGTFAGVEIIDIVSKAESPDADVDWTDVTQKTIDGGAVGGWKAGESQSQVPMPPPAVQFPPRDQTFAFGVAANDKYREKGAPQNGTIALLDGTEQPRHLNFEGEIVWLQQYLLYRVNGQSHAEATQRVLGEIDAAWPK